MWSLEFRLKKYMKQENLLEEIKHNDLMSEKHKKTCISAVNGCVSISAFVSFVGVPVGIMSSAGFLRSLQELKSITQLSKKEEAW